MSRPNILILTSDQHHPRVSGYRGNAYVQTPHLDRLAENGVSFNRAYSPCPVCGPARMSFLTGRFVHRIRNWWNCVPLPREERTWGDVFAENGYQSVHFGKIDAAGENEAPGFSEYRLSMRRPAFDPYPLDKPIPGMVPGFKRESSRQHIDTSGGFDTGAIPLHDKDYQPLGQNYDPTWGLYAQDRVSTDWAIDFLEQNDGEIPWIMHVGLEYPHWPFRCPEEWFEQYYPERVEMPFDAHFQNPELHTALAEWQAWNDLGDINEDDVRRTVAAYYGMVSTMDAMIGEVLDALEKTGQAENTFIIYSSDHGEALGEHGLFFKHAPYDGSCGIPLLISGPGIAGGGASEVPVSLVDIYPTLMDMAGIAGDDGRDGMSIMEIARGSETTAADRLPAFAEWHGTGIRPWYMLVDGHHKYVWFENESPLLFDLERDPREMTNLASDDRYCELLTEFEYRLRAILDPERIIREARRDLGLTS